MVGALLGGTAWQAGARGWVAWEAWGSDTAEAAAEDSAMAAAEDSATEDSAAAAAAMEGVGGEHMGNTPHPT